MTYYCMYSEINSKEELIEIMKRDIKLSKVVSFWGINKNRVKSIKEAGSKIADERGWKLDVISI